MGRRIENILKLAFIALILVGVVGMLTGCTCPMHGFDYTPNTVNADLG